MSVADNFKIIRESLGLSQKDMAKAINVSLASLQVYEAGRSMPGGNVIESLVKMGFNANWLLTGEGEMQQNEVGERPTVELSPVLDLALMEHIINEVIKHQRITGDKTNDLFIEALSRTTATTIINTYKACMDMPTASRDEIIYNYNRMFASMAGVLSTLHEHNIRTGDLCVLEKGVIVDKKGPA